MNEKIKSIIFEKYFDKEDIGLMIVNYKKVVYINNKMKEFAKLFNEDFEKTNPLEIFYHYEEYTKKNKDLQQFESLMDNIESFRLSDVEMNFSYVTEFKNRFLEFHFNGIICDDEKYYIISVYDVTNELKLFDYKYLDVSKKISEISFREFSKSNFNSLKIFENIYKVLKRNNIIAEFVITSVDEKDKNLIHIDFGIIDKINLTGKYLRRENKSLASYIIDYKKKVYIPNSLRFRLPNGYSIQHVGTPQMYSVYGVAMVNEQNECYGAILYERPGENTFNSYDFKLLDEVTYAIQTTIKFQKLYKELYVERSKYYEMSIKDYLTRAYNRIYLEEYLKNAYKNAKRYGEKFVLSFIDINDFKKINDTYGHDYGDVVLSVFSEVIMKNIRESDVFARYGGDEFIIVFPNSDEEDVKSIMERTEKKLLLQEFPIKISYGIQELDIQLSLEENLKAVDKRMYEMKNFK